MNKCDVRLAYFVRRGRNTLIMMLLTKRFPLFALAERGKRRGEYMNYVYIIFSFIFLNHTSLPWSWRPI